MQRLNYYANFKSAFGKLAELDSLVAICSVDPHLVYLVKIYASQLNGCAFCLDMHAKEAKINGERELRIYHLPVWRESPLFSEKEKAALKWTKSVTQLSAAPVDDELYESVKAYFNDQEMTELTMVIGLINLWNRFGAPFASTPGGMDRALHLEKSGLS